jgi:hypothetical protein
MVCLLALALQYTKNEQTSLVAMVHATPYLRNIVGVRYAQATPDLPSDVLLGALLKIDTLNWARKLSVVFVTPHTTAPAAVLDVVHRIADKCFFLEELTLSSRMVRVSVDVAALGAALRRMARLVMLTLTHTKFNAIPLAPQQQQQQQPSLLCPPPPPPCAAPSAASTRPPSFDSLLFPSTLRELTLRSIGENSDLRFGANSNPAFELEKLAASTPHLRKLFIDASDKCRFANDCILPRSLVTFSCRQLFNSQSALAFRAAALGDDNDESNSTSAQLRPLTLPRHLGRLVIAGGSETLPSDTVSFANYTNLAHLRIIDVSNTVLGHHVDFSFAQLPPALQEIRARSVRALGGVLDFVNAPRSLSVIDLSFNQFLALPEGADEANVAALSNLKLLVRLDVEGCTFTKLSLATTSPVLLLPLLFQALPVSVEYVNVSNTHLVFPANLDRLQRAHFEALLRLRSLRSLSFAALPRAPFAVLSLYRNANAVASDDPRFQLIEALGVFDVLRQMGRRNGGSLLKIECGNTFIDQHTAREAIGALLRGS